MTAALTDTEFLALAEGTLAAIERAVEACDADIESARTGNVLTLELADGSRIVINSQTPMRQLWVAAKSGGFHFERADECGAIRAIGPNCSRRYRGSCPRRAGSRSCCAPAAEANQKIWSRTASALRLSSGVAVSSSPMLATPWPGWNSA